MSAFMFVVGDKFLKEATMEQLKEQLSVYTKVVNDFDWSKYKQCNFDSDRAAGFKAIIPKIEAEIEMRKTGIETELPHPLVPGYNPGKVPTVVINRSNPSKKT